MTLNQVLKLQENALLASINSHCKKTLFRKIALLAMLGVLSFTALPATAKPIKAQSLANLPPVSRENNSIDENKALDQLKASFKSAQVNGVETGADEGVLKSLLDDYQSLMQASNDHNIDQIIAHYSSHFMSGDNLSISELKSLIQDTWKTYPNIIYTSVVKSVRISGDYASIETLDTSSANTSGKEAEINLPGKLSGESHNTIFYKRSGDDWEIIGDNTSWEEAIVRYGAAQDIPMALSSPEQVKAGELYSITFTVDPRKGDFAIAAINSQELVYPNPPNDDKFRPVNSSNKSIQRVIRANSANHNEIVSATIGIASIGNNDNNDRPKLGLDGVATIVKRVNVIPISQAEMLKALDSQKVTRTSANGKIDLNKVDMVNQKINQSAGLPQKIKDDNNSDDPDDDNSLPGTEQPDDGSMNTNDGQSKP